MIKMISVVETVEINGINNNIKEVINAEVNFYMKNNCKPEIFRALDRLDLLEDLEMEKCALHYLFLKRMKQENITVDRLPVELYKLIRNDIPRMVDEFIKDNLTFVI